MNETKTSPTALKKRKSTALKKRKKFDLEEDSDEALRAEQLKLINSIYQKLSDAKVGEETQNAFAVVLLEYRDSLTGNYEEMSPSQKIAMKRLRKELSKDIMAATTGIVRAQAERLYQRTRWVGAMERLVKMIYAKLPKGTVPGAALESRNFAKIQAALLKANEASDGS